MMEAEVPDVVCCVCGITMKPNKVNTCAKCLESQHDVTSEFAKNGVLLKCKGCDRYQKATQGWVFCEPESKALLALCLKKIKGLQKVSLIDANFIWTEEHSKRIKLKVTVQKEVTNQVVLRQSCVIDFTVQNKMCEDCHMAEANIGWNAIVQVRQKVDHKRTFLYLEQLILKHGEDARTIKVEPKPEGVDFYFAAKNDSVRFVDFLETVIPIKYKTSKKIISMDVKSNVAVYHFTFSVEIVPICKDDVVCLPLSTARRLGNVSQIVLCSNVSNILRFIDPVTCQVCDMSADRFWQKPFRPLMSAQRLSTFVVLDVQLQDDENMKAQKNRRATLSKEAESDNEGEVDFSKPSRKRRRRNTKKTNTVLTTSGVNISPNHGLALVEVARESDLGVNDKRFTILTHLGFVLKVGDTVLGYDMSTVNMNDEAAEVLERKSEIPDVILVRKHYPKWRKKTQRDWKLRSMVQNGSGDAGFGLVNTGEKDDALERDRELFYRDLEEDEEMRSKVNLYKAQKNNKEDTRKKMLASEEEEEVEEDVPHIPMESLLDDLAIVDDEDQDSEL